MPTTDPKPAPRIVRHLPAILGLLAGLAVLLTLGDPGITSDEPLDVQVGRGYIEKLSALLEGKPRPARARTTRAVVTSFFAENAQHPPLGRILVGIASTLGEPFEGLLGGSDPLSVHAARLAPMAAFAVLVFLVTRTVLQRYGTEAGVAAGLSLLLMPRVFAHAHFATLDTFLCLFWTLALFRVESALDGRRPLLGTAAAGAFWGLALLTKIHAWLLPPVVLVRTLMALRPGRAVRALLFWTLAGLAIFLVGWPWLWFDTIERLRGFLGTSVQRLPLRVEYLGRTYLDKDVPWHYPWLYFAVTVPLGLQILGMLGVREAWKLRKADRFPATLTLSILMWLVIFSTRAPVYDGERQFLVVFPLWAVLIGLGFRMVWGWAASRWGRGVLVVVFLAQGYGMVALHPFGLSYHNLLVGGLPGAERLGLELTYWGDAVDPVLLDELARRAQPGQTVALAPTLHHIQASASTTPALFDKGIVLREQEFADQADWVVVYRRTAYWSPEIRELVRSEPAFTRSRQGVWLSGIWKGPARKSSGSD